jgi:hypothetical protein
MRGRWWLTSSATTSCSVSRRTATGTLAVKRLADTAARQARLRGEPDALAVEPNFDDLGINPEFGRNAVSEG